MRWASIAKRLVLCLFISATLLAGGALVDADGDGLSNAREWQAGTEMLVADTDGDGLTDGAEVDTYGSNPTVADTDDDCLADPVEVESATNVSESDTDGDGFLDGVERKATERLPSADPTHKDVYVEVDYMWDYQLSADARDRIVDAYATAPVSNPNGEQGIDLHIVRDEQVRYVSVLNGTRLSVLKANEFDRHGEGYFYAVLVDKAENPFTDEIVNGLSSEEQFVATGADGTELAQGAIFMHELGHSLDLIPARFEGIDDRSVPFEDYPSVMNYNAPSEFIGYSNGSNSETDHDDWADIENSLSDLNTTELESEYGCDGYVDT